MPYSTVKLTGTYEAVDSTPDRGKVYIRATSDPILTGGDVVLSGLLEVHLDLDGHFEIVLPATDDPTLTPTNFGYKFWSRLDDGGNSPYFYFALPAATPVVDITSIIPIDPSTFDPDADYASEAELLAHEGDHANPHVVTKAQIGLGNAENTADLDKPISNAVQAALDALVLVGGGGGFYLPESYGAVGDGTTDDTTALQACIDDAADNGGGVCGFFGRYGWTGELKIKGGVTVLGAGGPKLPAVAIDELGLKALDATSKVRWGQFNDGSGNANTRPGPLMNLFIDGQGVSDALDLLRCEAVESSMFNVHVYNGLADGVNWTQSQNVNTFNLCIGGFPSGVADLLKASASGLQPPGHIVQYGGHVGDSLQTFQSTSWDAAFFVGPHDNYFIGTIFETGRTAGLGINSIGRVEDGDLHLINCVNTIGAQVTTITDNAVIVVSNDIRTATSTTLTLKDCTLGGGAGTVKAAHGVRIKGDLTHVSNTVYYFGRTSVANVTYMHCHDTADGLVQVDGPVIFITAVTDQFTTINGGTLAGVLAKTRVPRRYESISGMGSPLQIRMSTDTVANRLQISGLGQVSWLDGAAGAIRGSITRVLAGTQHFMTMAGIWLLGGGFGRNITVTNMTVDAAVAIDVNTVNHQLLNMTTNGADITALTVTGGYTGAELRISIAGIAATPGTITWPGTGAGGIVPRTTLPQPITAVMGVLDLMFVTDRWYEVGRSG